MIKNKRMMTYTLSNGVVIPSIGFGTYLATEGGGEQTILDALDVGYRYFDTAAFYGNETEIGNALAQSSVRRKDLFLCSKVFRTDLGYDSTKQSFSESLSRLQTDYLDLFLMHWPRENPQDTEWVSRMQETWRAMEELYEEGKIRAIGVSNFLPHHFELLQETAQICPMVNQLELHVGYMQEVAVSYCKKKNILVQAWSPLGRSRLFDHDIILKMCDKYKVTPPQFLLRFLLQNDIVVIPKASAKSRMEQNLHIPEFEIERNDMYFLRSLPQIGWSGEHPDL